MQDRSKIDNYENLKVWDYLFQNPYECMGNQIIKIFKSFSVVKLTCLIQNSQGIGKKVKPDNAGL